MKTLLVVLLLVFSISTASAQRKSSDTVRDSYRHFVMPTAKPVTGGFAGFWELAFLQGGFGVGDVLSVWTGFTVMPTVAFKSQFAFVNMKLTLADEGPLTFAIGGNFLRLTSALPYFHLFAIGTYETENKTRFTGMYIHKISGEDFPIVKVQPYGTFSFVYGGAVGVGVGFDTPLPGTTNMRIVGELWNHDVQSPNKIALLGALRVESEDFSSDFGFMYFTLPLVAPVANFVWRF